MNIDFADYQQSPFHGFDSYEDEQAWLAWLDGEHNQSIKIRNFYCDSCNHQEAMSGDGLRESEPCPTCGRGMADVEVEF